MAVLNVLEMIIGGKVTTDIELKSTSTGKSVVNFSIAVNRRRGGVNTAIFIDVVAYDKNAETAAKYFHKGSSIFAFVEPGLREFTTRDGVKKKIFEATVQRICFVDPREDRQEEPQYVPAAYDTSVPAPNFQAVDPDADDLPF